MNSFIGTVCAIAIILLVLLVIATYVMGVISFLKISLFLGCLSCMTPLALIVIWFIVKDHI